MKFKIGDKVVIKESCSHFSWYTKNIFTIKSIYCNKDVEVNEALCNDVWDGNPYLISASYLMLAIKELRKEKLLKLKKLNET